MLADTRVAHLPAPEQGLLSTRGSAMLDLSRESSVPMELTVAAESAISQAASRTASAEIASGLLQDRSTLDMHLGFLR